MQPTYMTGHSRPVRKVMHNIDGDLLFTCSDDGSACMYDTKLCVRTGVFEIKEACKSIDVTKDSKYLFAAAITFGIYIFKIEDGSKMATLEVNSIMNKQVELDYSDKEFFVLSDEKGG